MSIFTGAGTAIVTPFKASGEIDFNKFEDSDALSSVLYIKSNNFSTNYIHNFSSIFLIIL